MNNKKPKAIFFDLFETLITEFSQGKRISKRNYDYLNLLGIPNDQFKLEWRKRQGNRMNGFYNTYIDVIKDIAQCNQLQVSDEVIQYLYEERMKEKQFPFNNIHSDIVALLEYIRSKDIKIGLISNCTEEEVKYWHSSQLAQYFHDCIFSFEVKMSKPDPSIYVLACDRLNVTAEESIFIGDGGSSELEGAATVGLKVYHAVWFNTYINSEFKKLTSPLALIDELA